MAAAQGRGVAHRDEEPVAAGVDHLAAAPDVGGDDGRPIAAASIAARGKPSRCEASTNTSIAA